MRLIFQCNMYHRIFFNFIDNYETPENLNYIVKNQKKNRRSFVIIYKTFY